MTTTAIIIADGDGTRWGNHGGIPKHLAEVGGEPILHRTVRLLNRADDIEVWVAGPLDGRYKVPGAELWTPAHDPDVFDADKFLSSKALWNRDGRTLVVYGDVFWTDEAMTRVLDWPSLDWVLFGRAFASDLTGTPYGECFAQSFGSQAIGDHEAALRRIVDLYRRGLIPRCGGWEHYRAMIGIPDALMAQHLVGQWFCNIDDWTDDIDYPGEWERLVQRRQEAGL